MLFSVFVKNGIMSVIKSLFVIFNILVVFLIGLVYL